MKGFRDIFTIEIKTSLQEIWFYIYFLLVFGIMLGFLLSNIAASRIIGGGGLTRALTTYIEITIVILPLLILVITSRSLVVDKDSLNLEYILSYPISIAGYFWGRFIARVVIMIVPVYIAIFTSLIWGILKHDTVRWDIVISYSILTSSLTVCFIGIAYFISSTSKRQDTAISTAFFVWFFFLVLMDIGLLSVAMNYNLNENIILGMALANPIELFRVASFSLLNPTLGVIGPIAWTLLGKIGNQGLLILAYTYPTLLGLTFAYMGFNYFKRSDFL